MDTNSRTSTYSPVEVGAVGSSLENCEPGTRAKNDADQIAGNMLVSSKESAPSLFPQQPAPDAIVSSTRPELVSSPLQVEPEIVNLANHVSLQIFSTPATRDSKNVMIFLHGGPGLAYDASYAPMTEWFLAHGYTLVAPEIAGSGTSGLENKSNSHTRNYVRGLKSVVHCLRDRPDMQAKDFCVVAHSWGGFQLASLLTDESAEERGFFKQAAFIGANLDSAQTRLFADVDSYNDGNEGSLLAFERTLVRNFEERHFGSEENDESSKMTVLHNPLINQSLNEKFSPFYRLDKIPKNLPCLFFHATDDKQVPLSLSVDAFARVNDAGGNASIVISSEGGHSFFKAGKTHQPSVMTDCFDAIDALVKQDKSLKNTVIDKVNLPDGDVEAVEKRMLLADKTYENQTKALNDFHMGIAMPATGDGLKRIPPKRELLRKLAGAHENLANRFEKMNSPVARKNMEVNRIAANLINKSLETS